MYEQALKILNIIESFGYKAYIIGGYPRDLYLNRNSADIDICTDATPMELHKIFPDNIITNFEYGNVVITIDNIKYEISTFRREFKYKDNRHPEKIEYVNTLEEDIIRRDFTINTIAIDKDGKEIDLLNGKKDINNKVIRMVGKTKIKLKEDALRILRAVRFATILNFKIDPVLKIYIRKYGHLLKKISKDVKKNELDIIFSSPNKEYGIKLLNELKLSQNLDIPQLKKIKITPSSLVTWAQLNALDKYNFNSTERDTIIKINEIKDKNILDKKIVYEYGLYICTLAAELNDVDKIKLNEISNNLPIKSKLDIKISPIEICKILDKPAGPFLKTITSDLEDKILDNEIQNNKDELEKYIREKYID